MHVAAELIAHNVRRKVKGLFTENREGNPVRLVTYPTHKDEAEGIAAKIAAAIRSRRRRPRDFAIFYRINALSRAFEFALSDVGVPYQMVNGLEFFQRKEIKDVLAYLQLLNNPRDEVALLRVINTPTRGIGKTTIGRLSDYATRHGLTVLEAARKCRDIQTLGKRAVAMVGKFVTLFDRLASAAGGPVEEILGLVLTETGYQKQFSRSENEEDRDRLANIEELLTVAREYDERHPGEGHLEDFLEESSLVNDTDAFEEEVDRVTLMTLHASKGLEFPVVFLVAVEEGLLPHERSREQADQLEEERRLMFVGITRAQQELGISMAQYRDFRGQRKMTIPSHFLMELPREEMELDAGEVGPSFATETVSREPVSTKSAPSRGVPSSQLTTAAELANGGKPSAAVSPDVFHQGMLVRHREYGLGRIVAISGSGVARKATIDFVSSAGRKKFVLSSSPIHPVQ